MFAGRSAPSTSVLWGHVNKQICFHWEDGRLLPSSGKQVDLRVYFQSIEDVLCSLDVGLRQTPGLLPLPSCCSASVRLECSGCWVWEPERAKGKPSTFTRWNFPEQLSCVFMCVSEHTHTQSGAGESLESSIHEIKHVESSMNLVYRKDNTEVCFLVLKTNCWFINVSFLRHKVKLGVVSLIPMRSA